MSELLKPFWVQMAKWGGIIAGVLLVLLKARQGGKEAEQRKQAMEVLRDVQISSKIENNIAGASDAEYKRLYKRWSK